MEFLVLGGNDPKEELAEPMCMRYGPCTDEPPCGNTCICDWVY